MINPLLLVFKLIPSRDVFAHCDIPCGIYDPHLAQMAAHTVIRMTKLIQEAGDDTHKITRLTLIKEEHAEKVKHEVRVLWGDYFKPEHITKFPNLHDQVFEIMKLASKTKQEVNPEAADKLLELVQLFADEFYQTKGLETVRIASGYPTEGEIVSHK